MLHTLLLTDPDFYEELDYYDWAGSEFASGIAESADNARAGDAAAKIIANLREEVRILQEALDEERETLTETRLWLRDAQKRANELDRQLNVP